MNNPICISTGAVYRISEDMNKKIELLKEFSPDGIELCFADPQHLVDFQITEQNLSYLHSLSFVSIHAPWLGGIRYGNNEKSERILRAIENLYYKIKAQNVVFHTDYFDEIDIFEGFNFIVSLENVDWNSGAGKNIEEVKRALHSNTNFRFVFDFAHALSVSSELIPQFVENFKERISEVHLSMLKRDFKDHWFLHKFDSEGMRSLMNPLKALDVPIVLEAVATNETELSLIGKEMEYVREIFNT
jgi:endonuclease IV